MSVTVYVWLPNFPNVGHTSMMVAGGSYQGRLYISWWPEGDHNAFGLAMCTPYTSMGSYNDDKANEGQESDYTLVIPSGLDEGSIVAWWQNQLTDVNAQYCLLSENCSDVVHQALQAGGADAYVTGNATWNVVWTPQGVLEYVQAIQQGIQTQSMSGYAPPPGDPLDGGLPPGGAP
jgi:hypothetical protein